MLNWENKGVKIDGEFLSNLRFADDIFLCTETPQELQNMLQELSDGSRRMGLKMNIAKTKVMVVDNTPVNVNNVLIENVEGYIYTWDNTTASRKRTRTKRYNEESRHAGRHTPNNGISSKTHCHLPEETGVQLLCDAAVTCNADTWTLTKQAQYKLAAAQVELYI